MDELRWRRNRKWIIGYGVGVVAIVALLGGTRVTAISTSKQPKNEKVAVDRGRNLKGTVDLFDDSLVHNVELRFDEAEYQKMIETFGSSGAKEYVKATITIDGTTIDQVGIRLKGNSTLMGLRRSTGGAAAGGAAFPGAAGGQVPGGLAPGGQAGGGFAGPGGSASADEPHNLPWLVKFDEYIENQRYQGFDQLAVRPVNAGSSPNTVLHESLALHLIGLAGEPTERGTYSSFSVNGGAPVLRLIIEQPGDELVDNEFPDTSGALFKALAGTQMQYLGEDPLVYQNSFRQITSKKRYDYQPLINLIKFVTQSSDADFTAHLDDHVDTASLARYLALQNLLLNFDDMAGPGTNYFLYYNGDTKKFTVVSWDMNFALSGRAEQGPNETSGLPGGAAGRAPVGGQFPAGAAPSAGPAAAGGQFPGGGLPGQVPGQVPTGSTLQPGLTGQPPTGQNPAGAAPAGQFPGGGRLGGNKLKERFLADSKFKALYLAEYWKLYDALLASGTAAHELARLEGVLSTGAAQLIDPTTVKSEADRIRTTLDTRTKALATQR